MLHCSRTTAALEGLHSGFEVVSKGIEQGLVFCLIYFVGFSLLLSAFMMITVVR